MKLRLQLTKDKSISFIAHLEYAQAIERAMRRSKIKVKYSEGFNPHMKLSLASALGVGVASNCEYAEVELLPEHEDLSVIREKLSASLPVGIKIIRADIVSRSGKKLMAMAGGADYVAQAVCDFPVDTKHIETVVEDLLIWTFEKKIPKGKGFKEVDFKDFVTDVRLKQENNLLEISFSCKITPTGSLKASEIIGLLLEKFNLPLETAQFEIVRTNLYKWVIGKKCSLLE